MSDVYLDKDRMSRLRKLEKARREFSAQVKAFERDFGQNAYLNRAPHLPQACLDEARLITNRLQMIKRLPSGQAVAEIGVDRGIFSRKILEHCKPRRLVLVDIDLNRLDADNAEVLGREPVVEMVEGDSAQVLGSFDDESFGWIYIDADHSYGAVSRDIEAAAGKVARGGYLVFNDYTIWSPANMSNYGVARAVNEFLIANRSWSVAYFALQEAGYQDIALKRTR